MEKQITGGKPFDVSKITEKHIHKIRTKFAVKNLRHELRIESNQLYKQNKFYPVLRTEGNNVRLYVPFNFYFEAGFIDLKKSTIHQKLFPKHLRSKFRLRLITVLNFIKTLDG